MVFNVMYDYLHLADNIIDIDIGSCDVIEITAHEKEHYFQLYEKQSYTINEKVWYKIKYTEYKFNNAKKNEPMALWYSTLSSGMWMVRPIITVIIIFTKG